MRNLLVLTVSFLLFAGCLLADESKKDKLEVQLSGYHMEIVDQSEAKDNVGFNIITRDKVSNLFFGIGFFFPLSDYDNAFTGYGIDMFFGSYIMITEDFIIKDLSISILGGAGFAHLRYEDADGDEVMNIAVEILMGAEIRYRNILFQVINKPMIAVKADNFLTSYISIGYCF